MSEQQNSIPASSVLRTKASAELEESVRKDLEKDDPEPQKAKAAFREAIEQNSDQDQQTRSC